MHDFRIENFLAPVRSRLYNEYPRTWDGSRKKKSSYARLTLIRSESSRASERASKQAVSAARRVKCPPRSERSRLRRRCITSPAVADVMRDFLWPDESRRKKVSIMIFRGLFCYDDQEEKCFETIRFITGKIPFVFQRDWADTMREWDSLRFLEGRLLM